MYPEDCDHDKLIIETAEEAATREAAAQKAAETAALMEKRQRDERVLIYRNLLNGIPVWRLMEMFHKSEKEVMDIFIFVSRRLREYCFKRRMPTVFCDCIATAQKEKMALLPLLTKLNLDKQPLMGKMVQERLPNGVSQDIMMDLLHEHIV